MAKVKNALKIFGKDDAFGLFKNAVLAGGATNIDDSVLRTQFNSFLKNNDSFAYKGEASTTERLSSGAVKKIKAPEYDYNAVIKTIGDDFGYDLSKANSLSDVVLEGNTSYANSYTSLANKKRLLQGRKTPEISRTSQDIEEYVGDRRNITKEKLKEYRSQTRRNRNSSSKEAYLKHQDEGHNVDDDIIKGLELESEAPTKKDLSVGEMERRGLQKKKLKYAQERERIEQEIERDAEAHASSFRGVASDEEVEKIKSAYKSFQYDERISTLEEKTNADISGFKKRLGQSKDIWDEDGAYINDATAAKKVLNDATGKDGIGLWGTIKKHPIISTGVGVGAVWGVSELTEDDDL